jgi:exodeoxyribonuclease V gamma subunit
MERQRLLGDPHPADQDRYVLLEALLSARSHLLISWSCRDDRSGAALPPAGPVRQWLQWLEGHLGPEALAHLVAEHPASPLERPNFRPAAGRPPASCDRRRLEALRRLEGPPLPPPLGLALAAPPAAGRLEPGEGERFSELRQWLCHPQRHWLRQLGMAAGEWLERLDDLEAIELDERQRFALLNNLLTDGGGPDPRLAGDWRELSRGRGLLPGGAAGELEAEALAERWRSLQEILEGLGDPWQQPLAWGEWQGAPGWRGDSVVRVHPGKAKVSQRIELWLDLLLAAAAALDSGRPPAQGVLIARNNDRLVPELQLRAPEPMAARAQLERLGLLRQEWRDVCWPVPPRSGWAWLRAERSRPGTGFKAARQEWEGDDHTDGERDQAEMVVCFGADLAAATLVDGAFGERAAAVYEPLLEAEMARETRRTRR